MEGTSKNIAEILHPGSHYLIPGYQRNYQWKENRWQGLISDILEAATRPKEAPSHWLGVFLISQATNTIQPGWTGQMEYLVIDGQQRLTTIAIWVAAITHHAKDSGLDLQYDLSKIAKISVQESDRVAFEIVLQDKWRENQNWNLLEHQILRAYSYFRFVLWLGQEAVALEDAVKLPGLKKLHSETPFEDQWSLAVGSSKGKEVPRGASVDSKALLESTLFKVSLFSLIHNPAVDESQAVVFDTLNGSRQELEPLDHVRNSLFIRIDDIEAQNLYKHHWYPAETSLRAVPLKNMKPGKAFIYDYVISKGEKKRQKSINASRGASHFATMVRGKKDIELAEYVEKDLVPAMKTWQVVVRTQNSVVLNGNPTDFSQEALRLMSSIRDLSVGPANPVVLHYATSYVVGKITDSQLCEGLFLVENFLVRQILGGRPMSPLRARLMDLMGSIDGSLSIDKLRTELGASDWVENAELMAGISNKSIYESATPKALGAIFRGIERHLSGLGSMQFTIGTAKGQYSIEHIYPQKGSKWAEDLKAWGTDQNEMEKRRHVFGNLTVVTNEHNSAVGNKTFHEKSVFPTTHGNAAPLSLNNDWLNPQITRWTPKQIDDRSIFLINAVISHWKTI